MAVLKFFPAANEQYKTIAAIDLNVKKKTSKNCIAVVSLENTPLGIT